MTQGSVGVAIGSTSMASAEEMLRNADLAVYPTQPPFTTAVNVAARQLTSPWPIV